MSSVKPIRFFVISTFQSLLLIIFYCNLMIMAPAFWTSRLFPRSGQNLRDLCLPWFIASSRWLLPLNWCEDRITIPKHILYSNTIKIEFKDWWIVMIRELHPFFNYFLLVMASRSNMFDPGCVRLGRPSLGLENFPQNPKFFNFYLRLKNTWVRAWSTPDCKFSNPRFFFYKEIAHGIQFFKVPPTTKTKIVNSWLIEKFIKIQSNAKKRKIILFWSNNQSIN